MFRRSIRAALAALLLLGAGAAGASPAGAVATPVVKGSSGTSASWASVRSGVGGVAALGSYRRTGDRVRITGSLFDTADDGRAVRLDVRNFGGCCFRLVRNVRGGGTGVLVDVTIAGAQHVSIREVKYDDTRLRTGRWVPLF